MRSDGIWILTQPLLYLQNNLLVEFEHKDSVKHLLEQVSYFSDPGQMPVQSRLLYAVHSSNVYQQHSLPPAFIHTVGTKNFTQQQYQAADSVCIHALCYLLIFFYHIFNSCTLKDFKAVTGQQICQSVDTEMRAHTN